MKKINLIFLILFINCNFAFANDIKLNVGVSYFYADVNDPEYYFVDKYETLKNPKYQFKSVFLGLSKFYDNNFNLSVNTNRLFNTKLKRDVKRKSDNLVFKNKTETIIDSILFGYKIKRYNLSLIISNVKVGKFLYYKNSLVGYEKKTAITSGINLGYFATKNFIPSFTYILPNKHLNLRSAFSLNINYIF